MIEKKFAFFSKRNLFLGKSAYQARRIPAAAAHLLHFAVIIVDDARDRQLGTVLGGECTGAQDVGRILRSVAVVDSDRRMIAMPDSPSTSAW